MSGRRRRLFVSVVSAALLISCDSPRGQLEYDTEAIQAQNARMIAKNKREIALLTQGNLPVDHNVQIEDWLAHNELGKVVPGKLEFGPTPVGGLECGFVTLENAPPPYSSYNGRHPFFAIFDTNGKIVIVQTLVDHTLHYAAGADTMNNFSYDIFYIMHQCGRDYVDEMVRAGKLPPR